MMHPLARSIEAPFGAGGPRGGVRNLLTRLAAASVVAGAAFAAPVQTTSPWPGPAAVAPIYPCPNNPSVVSVVDLDQDGSPEVLVCTVGGVVAPLRNQGEGALALPAPLLTGSAIHAFELGDLNGDGLPDAAVPDSGGYGVDVLLGNGLGGFSLGAEVDTLSLVYAAAMGDMDGDGHLDVVVSQLTPPQIAVLAGDGLGGLGAPEVHTFMVQQPRALTLGDFDGDGRSDVAVCDIPASAVHVLRNDGAGGFDAPVVLSVGVEPFRVKSGDVTGDGTDDLLVVNAQSGDLSLLVTDAAGAFLPESRISAAPTPQDFDLADIDADGDLDLAVAVMDGNRIDVFRNNGAGSFGLAVEYSTVHAPTTVALDDVDGDGVRDLVAACTGFESVAVVRHGHGDGTFERRRDFAGRDEPRGVASGDLDGDGDRDLVVANRQSDDLSVHLNDGQGNFALSANLPVPEQPLFVVLEDLNGDGALDCVVSSTSDDKITTRLGNGAGSLTVPVEYIVGANPQDLVVADLDGSAGPDIAFIEAGSESLGVLLSTGPGTYGVSVSFMLPFGGDPTGLAVGDFDGDTFVDIAVTTEVPAGVTVFLGDGAGAFVAGPFSPQVGPTTAAAADMNGDGILDLVTADDGADTVAISFGMGDGTFQLPFNASVPDRPESIRLFDFDGDGFLDVAVSLRNASSVAILQNVNGFLGFPMLHETEPAPIGLEVADVTGDGIADIIAPSSARDLIGVLAGRGPVEGVGTSQCGPAATNSSGGPASLVAAGTPVVGRNDVVLRARGLPQHSFGYFLSSRSVTAPTPTPGDGFLCLGGAIGRYVGPGQIRNSGDDGAFTLSLDLRTTPTPTGLVPVVSGESWAFQAWFRDAVGGAATSNLTDALEVGFL